MAKAAKKSTSRKKLESRSPSKGDKFLAFCEAEIAKGNVILVRDDSGLNEVLDLDNF